MDKVLQKVKSGAKLTVMEQMIMLTSENAETLLEMYAANYELHPCIQLAMLSFSNSLKLLAVYAKKRPLHKQVERKMFKLSHFDKLAEVYIKQGHKFWDETELIFLRKIKNKSLVKEYIEENKGLLSDAALDLIEEIYYH